MSKRVRDFYEELKKIDEILEFIDSGIEQSEKYDNVSGDSDGDITVLVNIYDLKDIREILSKYKENMLNELVL